jgi:hypothetical protein
MPPASFRRDLVRTPVREKVAIEVARDACGMRDVGVCQCRGVLDCLLVALLLVGEATTNCSCKAYPYAIKRCKVHERCPRCLDRARHG